MGEDEAAALLLANIPGVPLAQPRLIKFEAGRREAVWRHNVIAIGLASGFLEPLESTSIHLIQTGIQRLLHALPSRHPTDAERIAFNADARAEIEHIRDFIILHYHANGRDEPMWTERRAMALPDSLAERIALFRETGRIASTAGQLFTDQAWQQVLIGQGILPRAVHPLTEQLSEADLRDFLFQNRRIVAHHAEAMPTHADFIARHCAAAAAPQPKDHAA
jgi:tryptophan halogenase